ncbi:MAG: DUF3370 domain-containing protein [Cyanobacteriota bacterium]
MLLPLFLASHLLLTPLLISNEPQIIRFLPSLTKGSWGDRYVANINQNSINSQQRVQPLPNSLNQVPVFNSNSPELVQGEGILLSTFPEDGKTSSQAHLNFPFNGRFDLFAHHVAKPPNEDDLSTLYLGILLHNPTNETVTVDILSGASYLSQPDAPFIELPSTTENPEGEVYSGPGSRVMDDILREKRHWQFPSQVEIPPESNHLLLNAPIPVRPFDPPLNGRSTYLQLESDGEVYAASLAQYAPRTDTGRERPPTLSEWETLLTGGELSTPRDTAPTPSDNTENIIYGRVAGVSQGSKWEATVDVDLDTVEEAVSYGISTLVGGRLGTDQVQSAPMLARYPDTAYAAHGNYGVEYDLSFNLNNTTTQPREVSLALETPVKADDLSNRLKFLDSPSSQVFFRGTIQLTYRDEQGSEQTEYFHLAQHHGERGEPLLNLTIPSQASRTVEVNLVYPPDATPPQVLTIENQ